MQIAPAGGAEQGAERLAHGAPAVAVVVSQVGVVVFEEVQLQTGQEGEGVVGVERFAGGQRDGVTEEFEAADEGQGLCGPEREDVEHGDGAGEDEAHVALPGDGAAVLKDGAVECYVAQDGGVEDVPARVGEVCVLRFVGIFVFGRPEGLVRVDEWAFDS